MKRYSGYLIAFEGVDGVGKSTLAKRTYNYLKSEGYKTHLTREPGGSILAEKIRELILSTEMDTLTEALLFHAARYDHYKNTILPLLNEGYIVVCDRFVDSSIVYQGYMKSHLLSVSILHRLIGLLKADITFIITSDIDTIVKRMSSRNKLNRLDTTSIEDIIAINNHFTSLAACTSNKFIIDNSESVANSLTSIKDVLADNNILNL